MIIITNVVAFTQQSIKIEHFTIFLNKQLSLLLKIISVNQCPSLTYFHFKIITFKLAMMNTNVPKGWHESDFSDDVIFDLEKPECAPVDGETLLTEMSLHARSLEISWTLF